MDKSDNLFYRKKPSVFFVVVLLLFFVFITIEAFNNFELIENTFFKSFKEYNGKYYKFRYDDNWSLGYVKLIQSDGTEEKTKALVYKDNSSYLVTLGNSKTSDIIACDFKQELCKQNIINLLYYYWNSFVSQSNYNLYKHSDSFELLNDNIYYFSFDVGLSKNSIIGQYLFIVDTNNDVVISILISSFNSISFNNVSNDAFKLLRKIETFNN